MKNEKPGSLTIVSDAGRNRFGKRLVLCRCDCGNDYTGILSLIVTGKVKTCGCYRLSGASRRTHGQRSGKQSASYTCWLNMRQRCENENHKQWKDYGGRGITYDPKWSSFDAFYADMGDPPPGMTLDRKNNDGNYTKRNCRWADRPTQRRNARNLQLIKLDGKMVCLMDYCKAKGISYSAEVSRLYRARKRT